MLRRRSLYIFAIVVVGSALAALWYMSVEFDPVSQYVAPSYTTETIFDDKDEGSTSIVALTKADSNAVFERINQQIRKRLLKDFCFDDPKSAYAADALRSTYLNMQQVRDTRIPRAVIESWPYETIRQHLISDFYFYQFIAPTVVFAEQGILSIQVSYEVYCGGAHPNHGLFGMNFDLKSGQDLSFKDIIYNYESNKKVVEEIVFTYAAQVSPPLSDGGCDYVKDFRGDSLLSADYFEYVVSKTGLTMLSFGYPHAMGNCEPSGTITIPSALLSNYLSPALHLPTR